MPVRQRAWRGERSSGDQISQKEGAESLDGCLIECRKKTGERRAIWQMEAAKEGQKGIRERGESLVVGLQCGFTTQSIADENHHKINGVILAKAGASKPDVLLDRIEHTQMGQNLSESSHFSQPGWS